VTLYCVTFCASKGCTRARKQLRRLSRQVQAFRWGEGGTPKNLEAGYNPKLKFHNFAKRQAMSPAPQSLLKELCRVKGG